MRNLRVRRRGTELEWSRGSGKGIGPYVVSASTSLRELRFAQVQLTLEFAQEFVADAALVAELDGGLALDLQELARDFDVLLIEHGCKAVGGRVASFIEAGEAGPVVVREVVVDLGKLGLSFFTKSISAKFTFAGVSFTQVIEMLECGGKNGAS